MIPEHIRESVDRYSSDIGPRDPETGKTYWPNPEDRYSGNRIVPVSGIPAAPVVDEPRIVRQAHDISVITAHKVVSRYKAKPKASNTPEQAQVIRKVQDEVAAEYGVNHTQLLMGSSGNRKADNKGTAIRRIAMKRCRELGLSYHAIGRGFKLDHATVHYHCSLEEKETR